MTRLNLSFLAQLPLLAVDESGPAQQLLWLWLGLGAAVLVFAFILAVARSWYLRNQQQKEVERELLAEFQEAVERGEMSPEEFARVRRLLVGRIAGDATVTNQPPAAQSAVPAAEEQLPVFEQQTYAPSTTENTGQPQESGSKNDNDSTSPQSCSGA